MFKSSLEICSQGYNVEQTDYYIANLEDRITFAEKAYADAVKRIEALEAENALLAGELNSKIALICEKLDVEIAAEPAVENDIEFFDIESDEADSFSEEAVQPVEQVESEADKEVYDPEEDIKNLKSQIDELKSFFEYN